MSRADPITIWQQLHWKAALAPADATVLLERLATAPSLGVLALEVHATPSGARWLLGSSVLGADGVRELVEGCGLATVTAPRSRRHSASTAAQVAVSRPNMMLSADRAEAIARGLLSAMNGLGKGEHIMLRVLLGGRLTPSQLTAPAPASWGDILLGRGTRPETPKRPGRGDLHGFACLIRIGADASSPGRERHLITQVHGALRVAEIVCAHLSLRDEQPGRLMAASTPWRWPMRLSTRELTGLVGWPVGPPPLPVFGGGHPRALHPGIPLVDTDRILGTTSAPGEASRVGIPPRDALFHTHLLGPTGSAKSTVMLNLIAADAAAGRGLLLLDPKGDLARDVLAVVPASRHADVVVIDPTSPRPVGLNPLAPGVANPELTADTLLATFESIFAASWGIRTADILTAAFLTLARTPGANLIWLPALLTNPAFRRKVLKQAGKDPIGTDDFWNRYDAKKPELQANEIAPVLNKLRQFILRPSLRATLGQSSPQFDLAELFTKRRIVVVNLNKGVLGADAAKLLGSLLIGQLWSLILRRASLPNERRHVTPVYIDEAADFLAGIPGDLQDALAQSRSLGVPFTLANQYLQQFTPSMRAAVMANTRNKIVWGLGGTDAADIAKTAPGLEAQDFMLLPTYHAYATLMQKGASTGWFSIGTAPPPASKGSASDLYAASQERYGVPATDTDTELVELLHAPGFEDHTDREDGPIGRSPR